jgi:hypothetical protein
MTTPNMQYQKKGNLRLIIISFCFLGLISTYSLSITAFAWGVGNSVWAFLILYLALFVSTILIISKVKFGYFILLFTSIAYSFLLVGEVGRFLIFEINSLNLFWILFFPFLIFLIMIPLTITNLTITLSNSKKFVLSSIFVSISFLIFSIADRLDKNYDDTIYINAKISDKGIVTLTCNPHFGDSRTFVINSSFKDLVQIVKKYGEFYQGSYSLSNSKIIKQYNFSELKSITLVKIDTKLIEPQITWSKEELSGDFSFLKP